MWLALPFWRIEKDHLCSITCSRYGHLGFTLFLLTQVLGELFKNTYYNFAQQTSDHNWIYYKLFFFVYFAVAFNVWHCGHIRMFLFVRIARFGLGFLRQVHLPSPFTLHFAFDSNLCDGLCLLHNFDEFWTICSDLSFMPIEIQFLAV